MKKILSFRTIIVALVLVIAPLMSLAADTTYFNDTFIFGSTLNQPPATPNPTYTSYQTGEGLGGGTFSIAPNLLSIALTNSSSVLGEVLAMFTNTPIALAVPGDHVNITVVFTNGANILSGLAGNNSTVNIGLFYSGGVAPNQGDIILNLGNTSGGTQGWIGYFGRFFWNPTGNNSILTRPAQTPNGSTSQNQDLLFSNASSTQAFNNPTGTSIGSTANTSSPVLTQGGTYTLFFSITLTAAGTYGITNTIYNGVGTGGSVLVTQGKTATGANYITSGFDGFAIGFRNSASAVQVARMDISSIEITGHDSSANGPPTITTQPTNTTVATGATCAFNVAANGILVSYQWHRHGTNLIDGGNISGATSSTLVVGSAGSADTATSGADGYYVTVSGLGGYSTNSMTNSLTLRSATNLVWTGSAGSVWDVNNTASWKNPDNNATVFNYGDPVSLLDGPSLRILNLTGSYLSAASVTMDSTQPYTLQGTGSFAGPGQLIIKNSGFFTVNSVNTYTGGTIISNAAAYLYLQQGNGLGSGPVTLAKAGGTMEVYTNGSATVGISGDINVADDFTIQLDGTGAFSFVCFGNLFGTAGKTLTLSPQFDGTTNRFRIYGTNSVCDANLIINGTASSQANYYGSCLAAYHPRGTQVYNGVISGNGGLVQRDSGMTILNGQNTYAGGTTPTTGIIAFGTDSIGAVTSGPIGTGPLFVVPEVPNATGSGQVIAWGGARTIANPIQYPSATNNQTLIIGGTNALTFTGSVSLNGLDGIGSLSNRVFQVTNTALTTFAGVVSDGGGAYSITKDGNGILALTATETYTGPTLASNGTLWVNGQLNAASAVTVGTNGTLGGTGTINGLVTVLTNGVIAPGDASIGTLHIGGNLAMAGSMTARVNHSGLASDQANVTGTINNTGAGTITVINTGSTLQVGDTFNVFNKGVTGGANMKVIGAGVGWNNLLASSGQISVAANTPPKITSTFNGSTLTLTWPSTYLGWQMQSNSVSLTSTNWFLVPNSGNVVSLNITPSANRTNVFYRLVQP